MRLGLGPPGEVCAAVVGSVVVVVPGGVEGSAPRPGGGDKSGKLGLLGELPVGLANALRQGFAGIGADIRVDIVAEKDKGLWLQGADALPHRLVLPLAQAG